MNCIFCENETSTDRSIEHIIPESLGNKDHTLPRGVVCDKCNNYFARKVESPILDLEYFKLTRNEEGLFNKRGRPVTITALFKDKTGGYLSTDIGISPDGDTLNIHILNEMVFDRIRSGDGINEVMFLKAPMEPPVGLLGRFLAKIAVESFVLRLLDAPNFLQDFIREESLKPIRKYARYGGADWVYHQRILYPRNYPQPDLIPNEYYQCLHEFDFLYTTDSELYFVLAIFGVEYVINMGNPSIDGYQRWLEKNDYISPLYTEKNIQAMKV